MGVGDWAMIGRGTRGFWGAGHLPFWGPGADYMSVLFVAVQQAIDCISVKIYLKTNCLVQLQPQAAGKLQTLGSAGVERVVLPFGHSLPAQEAVWPLEKPLPFSGLSFSPLTEERSVFPCLDVQYTHWGAFKEY